MTRKSAFGAILGLLLFATAGAQPSSAAGLDDRIQRLAGVGRLAGRDRQGLAEGGRVDVTFQWFDYSASMDAFTAGKIDGDLMTNGDTLVTGAGGGKGVMIMLTDYSNGNDIIVGKPGVKDLKALKGKKIGIEVGLVEHLLLLHGLESRPA